MNPRAGFPQPRSSRGNEAGSVSTARDRRVGSALAAPLLCSADKLRASAQPTSQRELGVAQASRLLRCSLQAGRLRYGGISRLTLAATKKCARAFTLVEVMIASLVLVFGIVSAISAMQSGVRAMDRTRKLALATQVLQTEMEQLRLKSWTQLEALDGTATFTPDSAASGAGAFTCTRRITSPKTDMKEITLTAEWRGSDGRPQTAKLVTRYGRNGLNDYISTAH